MKTKVNLKNNNLIISKKLSETDTYKITDRNGIFSVSIFKKPQIVAGVTSYCSDGRHIIMLDYDDTCKWIVEQDINRLIIEYDLTPFYLFKTKEKEIEGELYGNYHAICLTKKFASDIIQMQRTTHCDSAYASMPLRNRYRSWVLRISDKKGSNKPEFVKTIQRYQEINNSNLISSPHLKLLKKLYDIPEFRYNGDNHTTLHFNHYETGGN